MPPLAVSSLPHKKQSSWRGLTQAGRAASVRVLCGVLVAMVASITAASPGDVGEAEKGKASELVLQLSVHLEELAAQFNFDVGTSTDRDQARFDELLGQARSSLDAARGYVGRDQLCDGVFKLARSVSQLEHAADYGAARGLPDWTTAEHLASSTTLIMGAFLEDLIPLAGKNGADSPSLDRALEAQASGGTLRRSGEWTSAAVEYVAGTCALSKGPPSATAARRHAVSQLAP